MISNKIKFWLPAVLLLLSLPTQAKGSNSRPPDFSAADISGQSITLSDLKGKVVLLDFWATWCPPCRVEIPNLLEIHRQFKNKKFVLISISLDRDISLARQFVKEKAMNWVHIIEREAGNRIATLYEIEYIPATFIIDRAGNLVARNLRGSELKKKIADLLK